MIRGVDPSTNRFLTDIGRVQRRSERAQAQLTSGLRVQNASDDPDLVCGLLQSREDLARAAQILDNTKRIKTEVDTAEQALQSAVKLVERARVLGAQGMNGTQTAETRLSIAGEVEAVLRQLVGVSNTSLEGRFLFSGDSDQVPPYALDPTQPNGVSAYAGSAATRLAQHPSGMLLPVAQTAQEVFDNADPQKNVFAAVNALMLALEANDPASIETALGTVGSSLNHLNARLSFCGTAQNQADEALDSASKMTLRLRGELSRMQDADVTEAIVEFQQAQFHLETAMKVHGNVPRQSLFDFLF